MDHEATADLHEELRLLLNTWDPLGVADLAPDEYDGLAGRVLGGLAQGATTTEMGEFMWLEMEELFGSDPAACEADKMGARLAFWYSAKQGTDSSPALSTLNGRAAASPTPAHQLQWC